MEVLIQDIWAVESLDWLTLSLPAYSRFAPPKCGFKIMLIEDELILNIILRRNKMHHL